MKKNRKASLTAVGAVVAAGLGIAATNASAGTPPALTAADVVAIDGQVLDTDALLAQQQVVDQNKRSPESARRDSIRLAEERQKSHRLVYGPPRPRDFGQVQPNPNETPAEREQRIKIEQLALAECCARLSNADAKGIQVTADSRLTRDLGMDPEQMNQLAKEINERHGVLLTIEQLEQLSTVRRIVQRIVNGK